MTALLCSLCGDEIEAGERLPWRHKKGLRPNVRPHYASPAPRSAADDLARARGDGAVRRDARLSSEALDGASVVDPLADPPSAGGIPTPVDTHVRPGPEPSGVIRSRAVRGPRTTSRNGGSPRNGAGDRFGEPGPVRARRAGLRARSAASQEEERMTVTPPDVSSPPQIELRSCPDPLCSIDDSHEHNSEDASVVVISRRLVAPETELEKAAARG